MLNMLFKDRIYNVSKASGQQWLAEINLRPGSWLKNQFITELKKQVFRYLREIRVRASLNLLSSTFLLLR